ncbi:MAG: hypothetical protein DHS20C21_09850 [Gemmatimonadota bacterium]|nr:MAG: hypothetical protein DHS20C21_09850 [Gemmatimonadota bacterium]
MRILQRFGLVAMMAASVVFSMGAEVLRTFTVPDPDGGPDRMMTVYGLTTIAEVNQNDANGRALLGEQSSQVTVRGVVQSATGALDPKDVSNPSAWFYISDGTGSVAVSKASAAAAIPSVAVGDSVEVATVILTQPNSTTLTGTRTLDFDASFFSDHLTILATGRPVNAPTTVTLDDLVTNGTAVEGDLVRVDGVSVVAPAEWPLSNQSGFVRITDGIDTVNLYVDNDTDLDAIPAPSGSFSLTGFVAQEDLDGAPFFQGHFLYPRSTADILQGDGDGTAVVSPSNVTEFATGVNLVFTLAGVQATLTAVELDVPATWTWSGSAGDVTLGGAGFSGASAPVVTSNGGGWSIRVDGTTISSTMNGTVTLANLTAPAVESSIFTVRTSAGGPAAAILLQPVVSVNSAALPGQVVINELLPVTNSGTQGSEGGEFIELFNRTTNDLVIGGWTLQDIGRTSECTLDARWAFPVGTVIPAQGYVVVCRNAFDAANNRGFLVDFPSFPGGVTLLEMFDSTVPVRPDVDHPATPNMVLLDPTADDNQIILLGGANTNVGQCSSPLVPFTLPSAELVVLKNVFDVTIDAVAYDAPTPCEESLCAAGSGAGPAYPFGPPKPLHSLGRNALAADTDDSAADLRPATQATPGAVNVPGDTDVPRLVEGSVEMASGSVFDIHFDEVVDEASATDPANYSITLDDERGSIAVVEVLPDRVEPFRHYVVITETIPAGATGTLVIDGVADLAFDGQTPNTLSASVPISTPLDALSICEVQTFDERGFSPYDGEVVTVAGFVTILPTSTDRFGIWVQEPGALGCGVNVFNFDYPDTVLRWGIELNDMVRIRGRVTEFVSSSSGSGAVTEIAASEDIQFFELIARGLEGPEPRIVSTHGANDETLEGTLVRTSGTVINANSLAAYIDDGSGSIQVFQNFSAIDLTRYTVGDVLQVTGVLTQFDSTEPFFSGYELIPQSQDAIVELDGTFARSTPTVEVARGVLVPELGEEIRITVTTTKRSDIIVEIFDVMGRKVITLYDGLGLGLMTFDWDGVGQDGSTVKPGAYVCHIRTVPLDGGSVLSRAAPIVVGTRLN